MKRIMGAFLAVILAFGLLSMLVANYWLVEGGKILARFDDKQTTIGVILTGGRKDGGWNDAIAASFDNLKIANCNVKYVEHISGLDGSFETAADKLINEEGAGIIVSMGMARAADVEKFAAQHPRVLFYSAAGESTQPNVCGFFVRAYQAHYQAGVLAGIRTKTHHLGFLIPGEQPLLRAAANAFTLGARSVDNTAVVHIINTGTWRDEASAAVICERNLSAFPIDVLGQTLQFDETISICRRHNVKAINFCSGIKDSEADVVLASIVWDSETFWRRLISDALNGRFSSESRFASIDENMRLDLAPSISEYERARVEAAGRRLRYFDKDVFFGPVVDNRGVLRVKPGENISDEALISSFNWYVAGVSEEKLPEMKPPTPPIMIPPHQPSMAKSGPPPGVSGPPPWATQGGPPPGVQGGPPPGVSGPPPWATQGGPPPGVQGGPPPGVSGPPPWATQGGPPPGVQGGPPQ